MSFGPGRPGPCSVSGSAGSAASRPWNGRGGGGPRRPIASFAFDRRPGVTRTVAIAVSAHQQGNDIVLTYEGGRDLPSLSGLDVTGTEADGMAISGSFAATPPAVGDVLTLAGTGNPGTDHVVVVATLVDGSRQVVIDVVV